MSSLSSGPQYSTWIRQKKITTFAILTLLCFGLALLSLLSLWFLVAFVPAVLFGYIWAIIGLSAFRFSEKGGDYQNRVHQLIVQRIKTQEAIKILDIGCGSAHLAIKIAKAYPKSQVFGIDYWGEDWEYSKVQCETNAQLEGVADRTHFEKHSASQLPFSSGEFDLVVSCLTFHEVMDVERKSKCLKEALRVLKVGGKFIFIDLFADSNYYDYPEEIFAVLKESGSQQHQIKPISDEFQLPFPLNDKKVLKYACLLEGTKSSQ